LIKNDRKEIKMDYVLMPKWISDISDIHSKLVHEFLHDTEIKENIIDMQLIREYYRKNSSKFNLLVTELSLRGFTFYSAKPNNVLPKFRLFEDEELIFVRENKDLYRSIDFEVFNLGSFLSRFEVKDDRFFNFIPLKGFEALNPAVDIKRLKENFIRCGYKIYKSGGLEEVDLHISSFEKNEEEDTSSSLMQEAVSLMSEIGHKRALAYINDVTKDSIEYENSKRLYLKPLEPHKIKYKMEEVALVFQDYGFNSFLIYCKDKNIKYCSEIDSELLEGYKSQRSVGIGKFNKVMDTLAFYFDDQDKAVANFENHKYTKILIKDDVYEIFNRIYLRDIQNLYKINIPEELLDLKLEDINEKRLGSISTEYSYNQVISIVGALNSIILPQKMLKDFIADEKNKEDLNILDLRFNQGKTLNEVGIKYNVTRERIRQKESKTLEKINKIFSVTKVKNILRVISYGDKFFTKEHLKSILGESYTYLLNIIAHNKIHGLYFFEEISMFSFEAYSHFININKRLSSILPDIFKFEDYHEVIRDFLHKGLGGELKIDNILNILDSVGYTAYGQFFSRGKLNLADALEIIFMYYIDKPLLLDEQGFEKIKRIAKKELNFSYNSSLRAIDARIRYVENIILTDNKTFFHISRVNFNEEIIQEIDAYLEEERKERNIINIEVIYNTFYDKLGELKQYSKLALYSFIRIYLGDKYKIGEGNTLDIYLDKESERITREQMIIEYLKEHGGLVNKKELLSEFKWKMVKLDDTVSKSKKIISWGRDNIKLVEYIIASEEIIEQFSKILSELMKDGFTTSKLILDESVFYGNLGEFIAENGLNDKYKINGLMKCMFDNLRGNTIFLYNKDCKYTNIFEVLCDKFVEGINRGELSSCMENLGYEGMIAGGMFDELIRAGKFIEISNIEAIAKEKFIVDNVFTEKLISEVNLRMGDKEYISLSDLEGIRRELPRIDFRLNANFYRSVLSENGFKSVVKYNSDYRYDKVIVVRETSNIDTFEDLVYHTLKAEYIGDMHESRIYDFLTDKGFVREQELLMDKKLPAGIYRHDKINIDELGFVKLVGGEE
jgi:hypothetical protein